MSQTFTLVAIIGFSLAVVLAIIAAILFFALNIKQVRNDLTGKTATRSIAEIRARAKTRKRTSSEAGKKLGWDVTGPVKVPSGPLKSYAEDVSTADILDDEPATTHLTDDSSEDATTMLSRDESGEEETTVLSSNEVKEEDMSVSVEEDESEEQTTVLSGKKSSKIASGATLLLAGLLVFAFGPGAVVAEGAGLISKGKPGHAVATKAMVKYAESQVGVDETSSEDGANSTEGEATSTDGASSADGVVSTDETAISDETNPNDSTAVTSSSGNGTSATFTSGNGVVETGVIVPLGAVDNAAPEFGQVRVKKDNLNDLTGPVSGSMIRTLNGLDRVIIEIDVFDPVSTDPIDPDPTRGINPDSIRVRIGSQYIHNIADPLSIPSTSYPNTSFEYIPNDPQNHSGMIKIELAPRQGEAQSFDLTQIRISIADAPPPGESANTVNNRQLSGISNNPPTNGLTGTDISNVSLQVQYTLIKVSDKDHGFSFNYEQETFPDPVDPINGYTYFKRDPANPTEPVTVTFNINNSDYGTICNEAYYSNECVVVIRDQNGALVEDFTYAEFLTVPGSGSQDRPLSYSFNNEGIYTIEITYNNCHAKSYNPPIQTICIDKTGPTIAKAELSKVDPAVWNWIPSNDAGTITFTPEDNLSGINWNNDSIEAYIGDDPNNTIPVTVNSDGTVTLTFPGPNQRVLLDTVTVFFHDIAGNVSDSINPPVSVSLRDLLNKDSKVVDDTTSGFLIDGEAPQIDLAYSGGAAQNEHYFNAPRVATFTITEETFDLIKENDKSRSIVTIYRDESSSSITADEFTSVDGRTWTATYTFDADGDYRLEGSLIDVAGNTSNSISDSFVIDQTEPFITIDFNNNEAGSGRYYNSARTATVTIRETNFSESLTSTLISALDDAGTAVTAPAISGWTETEEDTWEATVAFTNELHYALKVGASDLAGNVGEEVEEQEFVIDTTNPTIRIEQVTTNTAYANVIAPKVYFEDVNFENYRAKVSITAHSKVGDENNEEGRVHLKSTETKTDTSRTDAFEDIPYEIKYDDVYTLVAEIEDKAGNTAKETVVFSVNRFGSNYEFTTKTKAIVGTYMPEAQEIIVIETNVCGLESSWAKLSRNNQVSGLATGEDYTINVLGDQSGWSRYEYVFPAELFADDGYYRVLLSSEDNAGNLSENLMMGKNSTRDDAFEVSFAVDGTSPVGSLGNITEGETIFSPAHNVDVFAGDNMEMSMVTLFVNGEEKQSWSAEEFAGLGMQGYELPASDIFNTVSLEIIDRAGNATTVNTSNVLITNDLYKYIMNTPAILYPAVAALSVLTALAVLLTIRLIRKGLARRRARANRIEFVAEA